MIAVSSMRERCLTDNSTSASALLGRSAQALPRELTTGLSTLEMLRVDTTRASFRSLEAGESLYFQGDEGRNAHLLLDGWAFRHQSLEDGRRQIVDFALPGAVFGLAGAGPAAYGVETLTPCRFSVFTRENLFALLQQVPALSLRFVELLAAAEARAFDHLTSVGRRSARERVASLLLELLMRARRLRSAEQMPRMTLPLMQPHIADALGLASETVCRTLAAMRKDGIAVLRARKLDVLDIDRLAAEAGVALDQASLPVAAGRPGPVAPSGSPPMERVLACA